MYALPTKAPHKWAMRDLYHMKIMMKWPRLSAILTAAVMAELVEQGTHQDQWAKMPIRTVQTGPLVIEQWRRYRTIAQRGFIRHAWKHRHELRKNVTHELLIHYSTEWSALVWSALESFEPVIVDFFRHMAEQEGREEETPPAIPAGHVN